MFTTINEFRKIFEIGEATIPPYEFIAHRDPDFPTTTLKGYFTTEEQIKYTVTGLLKPAFAHIHEMNISFESNLDPNDPDLETNHHRQYKIMSTVIAIVKKFLEIAPEVNELSFTAKQKEEYHSVNNTNQRLIMYKKYIQKNFPGWKISSGSFRNKIRVRKPE